MRAKFPGNGSAKVITVAMAMEGVVARVRTGVLKAWLLSKGIDLRGCLERRDLEDEAKKLNGQENEL